MQAVAEEGDEALFERFLALGPDKAPANSSAEFLPLCGVVGLGRIEAEGKTDRLEPLRPYASDPRWRMREEGVAMALQRLGEKDMGSLWHEMERWSQGNLFEKRAAALCEPKLLRDERHVRAVLHILDAITASLSETSERRSDGYRVLKKTLGYCWSVAASASAKRARRRWRNGSEATTGTCAGS